MKFVIQKRSIWVWALLLTLQIVHINKDTKQKFHNVVLNIDCPLLYDIREDCNLSNDRLKQRHITVAVMACWIILYLKVWLHFVLDKYWPWGRVKGKIMDFYGFILDILDHHDIWLFTCMPNFNSLAWLEVCQEPPILQVHTWKTLVVPDWRFGGWGLLWFCIPSWKIRMKLSWKFGDDLNSFGWDIEMCYLGNKNVTNRKTHRYSSNLY